ncbi:MAG: hypothetical protein LBL90_13505 [Prevotellaceae bacterium]|jgi:hypothetical protein|nr:hypothetical protein [Prevotellaceae bacterium]
MPQVKKHAISLICTLALSISIAQAQAGWEKYRQQRQSEFKEYIQKNKEEFKNYRDSVNREFASFLEKEWTRFDLQKPEPPIKKPIPVPPVYDPAKPEPKPEELPLAKLPVIPIPEIVAPKQEIGPTIKPIPIPEKTINSIFFGTSIKLKDIAISPMHLPSVAEKDIANYWKLLTNTPYVDIMNEALRIKAELQLNDWGLYQLLNKLFKVYFPKGTVGEQVIFTVFMLNQMEYQAKMGKGNNDELIPLIAFSDNISNCLYFTYNAKTSTRYYAINPSHRDLSSARTYTIDYADAANRMNLGIAAPPLFTVEPVTESLVFNKNTYALKYNKNVVDFYRDYPCAEFSVYAEAPLDKTTLQSIEEQITPNLVNKSQEEAVNWLLHFVQNAFEYKTDHDQFGYEKYFFAEETIASLYSDCEDRAILFTQLVRRLLKMPVVLIYYPGVHLAAAVKFDNANTVGDYVTVDGAKYLICDPTYINANLGMAMPKLKDTPIKVINVR